jgi:hypothetical protein
MDRLSDGFEPFQGRWRFHGWNVQSYVVFLFPENSDKLVLDIVLRHLQIGFDGVKD